MNDTFKLKAIIWLPDWLHQPYKDSVAWTKLALDSKEDRAEFLKNILRVDARWVPPHGSKSFNVALTNHQRSIVDKLIAESARLAHAQAQLGSLPPPSKRIYRIDSVREFFVRAILVSMQREESGAAAIDAALGQVIEKARADPTSISSKLAAYLAEHRPDVLPDGRAERAERAGQAGKPARTSDQFIDYAIRDALRKTRSSATPAKVKRAALALAAATGLFEPIVRAIDDPRLSSALQQALRDAALDTSRSSHR